MSSLPRTSVWTSYPHPWQQVVGVYSSGVMNTSGQNILFKSEGHTGPFDPRGPDRGGDFYCLRNEYSETSNFAANSDPFDVNSYPKWLGDFGTWYQGGQFAIAANVRPNDAPFWGDARWPCPATTDNQLYGLGTTYISRVLPTSPVVGLATAIGELREGIPKLGLESLKKRSSLAKSAGSDYLNYEFGWKPLISDVKKLAKAVNKQDDILRQYERNSGKVVKRKRTFTDTESVEVYVYPGVRPQPDPYFWISTYVNPGVLTITVTYKVKRWFSGAFTYYLEPDKGINRGIWSQKANKLYGTRLTPEVLWNLTPWSWAADWFGNTGDVLKNVSAFANDGLVMPYAYVMEQSSCEIKYNLDGVTYPRMTNASIGPYNFEQIFTKTAKRRLKASPYGFGLNPDLDFSNRQKAIVAALGLSRSHKRR